VVDAGDPARSPNVGSEVLRLLVLTPAPTPYRDPFWAEVARQPGVDLLVCYLAKESRNRPWRVTWKRDFPYRELSGINFLAWRGATEACYWNPEVRRLVRPEACDAVILGGYNHLTLLVAMRKALRCAIPFYVMSESHLRNRRPAWKAAFKRPLVRWIVRHAAGLFPTGTLAADYFRHYGATDEKMVAIPNAPDVVSLMNRTALRWERRDALRRDLGLAGREVILFAGRLIRKKGVDTLIEACGRLPSEIPWRLVVVGEGTYRHELERLARARQIADRVQFAGFVQPDRLADWYLAADLFVLPSSETWGVVAIEALACGLPVILSDQTGCWPDVLEPTDQARRVFPFGNADELADRILRTFKAHADRADVLRVLRPRLSAFQYNVLAERFVASIRHGSIPDHVPPPSSRVAPPA